MTLQCIIHQLQNYLQRIGRPLKFVKAMQNEYTNTIVDAWNNINTDALLQTSKEYKVWIRRTTPCRAQMKAIIPKIVSYATQWEDNSALNTFKNLFSSNIRLSAPCVSLSLLIPFLFITFLCLIFFSFFPFSLFIFCMFSEFRFSLDISYLFGLLQFLFVVSLLWCYMRFEWIQRKVKKKYIIVNSPETKKGKTAHEIIENSYKCTFRNHYGWSEFRWKVKPNNPAQITCSMSDWYKIDKYCGPSSRFMDSNNVMRRFFCSQIIVLIFI